MFFVDNRANVQTDTCKVCGITLIILKTEFVNKITVNIVTQRVTSQAVIHISQMNIIYIIIKCI